MSTHRHRDSTNTSEQLLAEVARRTPDIGDRLATLLAAAVPSTDPGTELRGERDAVVALRTARLSRSIDPGSTRMRTPIVAKILTVKAAVIIAILGIGSVAVAAGAGVLPIAAASHAQHASQPAVATTNQPGHIPDPGHSDPSAHPDGPSTHPTPVGSPSPSLVGLCDAFTNLVDSDRGKALQSPAFQALVSAAGSPQAVPGFCASLNPTPKPTHPTPTQANPTHPTPSGTPNPHASSH